MADHGITEVGKYRVVEQVGEGAMGVVYRALDPVLNRTVAIKVMSEALARDDELRGRFLREAQAAGSLQHPNLVTIYDFGEVDGHLYIAMEFVNGEDLEAIIRKQAPLTLIDKIDILVDILAGLGYAHKRGVVHRDIKPANIRIDEEGRARIMDFGIAHLQSSKLTRTGLMVGTPAYMAPEQVSGHPVSAQTDIFSVGAVMYELFSGMKPFEGESLQSVFYKIVSQAPLELSSVAPNLPASLNAIVMRALAKDPADRFASASEMAGALTEARARLDRVSSQPKTLSLHSSLANGLQARTTRPMRVQETRQRSQLIVAASAGALLLVASIGIVVTLASKPSARPPASDTREEPQTNSAPTASPATNQPSAPAVPSAPAPVPEAPAATVHSASPTPAPKTADKPAARTTKTTPAGPTTEELTLFRSAQSAALETRRRAVDAGATAELLRVGDDHHTAANGSVQQGKVTEAASLLNLATTAWAAAERDARAAAAARARAAEVPRTDPAVVPPPAVASPPSVASQPAAPAPASPRPSATPQAEIALVMMAYERAIETRDVSELRRAYPSMTPAQARNWEDFFKSLRSITAELSLNGLDIRGDVAEGRVTGAYDYVTTAGKSVRQPANFQASFRRENGVWKLTAVR